MSSIGNDSFWLTLTFFSGSTHKVAPLVLSFTRFSRFARFTRLLAYSLIRSQVVALLFEEPEKNVKVIQK